jgi:hypothetical protein
VSTERNVGIHPTLVGLLVPNLRASTNFVFGLLTSGVVISSDVAYGCLFSYMETRLLERSSLGISNDALKSILFRFKKPILIFFAVSHFLLQVLLFLFGNLVNPTNPLSSRFAFWIPILWISLTLGLYLVIINLSVHYRLKRSRTGRKIAELLRQLVVVAAVLGVTVALAVVICIFQFVGILSPIDYILYELFWFLCPCVNLGIFFLLIRQQKKQPMVVQFSTDTTASMPASEPAENQARTSEDNVDDSESR